MKSAKNPIRRKHERILEEQHNTKDKIENQLHNRDLTEEARETATGRTEPPLGPSDSSDSRSDMPANAPDTDSDRENTGDRPDVENDGDDWMSRDVAADKVIDESGNAEETPREGGKSRR